MHTVLNKTVICNGFGNNAEATQMSETFDTELSVTLLPLDNKSL
jgi:hypothetical protein